MHDWPVTTSGEIPSPWLIAAWARLGIVPADSVTRC